MTLPDTPEIMEHILGMIRDAKEQYDTAVAEYKNGTVQDNAGGRIQYELGRLAALSDMKRWILEGMSKEAEL